MVRIAAPLTIVFVLCSFGTAFADGVMQQAAPMAQVAPMQTREAFVRGLTGQVMGIIHQPDTAIDVKKKQLEGTFLQVVDLGWIAQTVLGKPWEGASAQQRAQYVQLYGKYLSSMYLAGLTETTEQNLREIRVMGMDDAFDDAFVVHTQMVMAQGNNVAVDYLVREENGQRKVMDIILEGVSMLKTHRAELGALASSKGMDGVITALQAKLGGKEMHMASAQH